MSIDEGIAAYEEGNLVAAEGLLREALEKPLLEEDAGCAEVYLGAIAGQRKEPEVALTYLERALQRKLSVALVVSARYHAGLISCELGKFTEAAEHLTEALRLAEVTPGAATPAQLAESTFLLGWARHEVRQYEQALVHFQAAGERAALCPPGTSGLGVQVALWKGFAHFHLERYEEALGLLGEALEPGLPLEAENRAVGQYYRAECLSALGRYQEATAVLRAVLSPPQPQTELPERYKWRAHYLLGKAYYEEGSYAEAVPWLEMSAESNAASPIRETYVESLLGICLVELGRTSDALRHAKRGYEADPANAFRTICFARVLSATGAHAQAIALLADFEPDRLPAGLQEDLLVQQCWLFATVRDRSRYEASYNMLRSRFPNSHAISKSPQTRRLPLPESMAWS